MFFKSFNISQKSTCDEHSLQLEDADLFQKFLTKYFYENQILDKDWKFTRGYTNMFREWK